MITYFLAGTVFWRFHNFNVWSSDAVIKTGSTGWNAKDLTPSKWLLETKTKTIIMLQIYKILHKSYIVIISEFSYTIYYHISSLVRSNLVI